MGGFVYLCVFGGTGLCLCLYVHGKRWVCVCVQ